MSIGNITDPATQQEIRRLREELYRLQSRTDAVLRDVGIITRHSKLTALSFADSGHTGFASSAQLTAHTGDSTIHFTTSGLIVRQATAPKVDGTEGDLWEDTTSNPTRLYARITNGSGTKVWVHLVKAPA